MGQCEQNIISEWEGYRHDDLPVELWRRYADESSSDLDLLFFLYALVRMLKPKLICETGTHLGRATYMLGMAVRHNGIGEVVSADPTFSVTAAERCKMDGVSFFTGDSLSEGFKQFISRCDFLFSDSSIENRKQEFLYLKPGAIALIDDTIQEKELSFCLKEHITFNTPRGFTLVQRKP